MISIIARILLIAFAVWFLMRLLLSLTVRKPSAEASPAADGKTMVKDPVCGMYMDSRLAIALNDGGKILYFCSEGCKEKYLSITTHGGRDACLPPE